MKEREEEFIALNILNKLFVKYQGLKILEEDKPDLKDLQKSIGVEVTSAINPNIANIFSYINRKSKNYKKSPRPKAIERAQQEGVVFNGEQLDGFYRFFSTKEIELLHNCIKQKYSKRYTGFNTIDLFIFFRQYFLECLSDNDIQSLFQTIENCEEKYGKIFNNIIIDFYNKLLILDTTLKTREVFEIDNNI